MAFCIFVLLFHCRYPFPFVLSHLIVINSMEWSNKEQLSTLQKFIIFLMRIYFQTSFRSFFWMILCKKIHIHTDYLSNDDSKSYLRVGWWLNSTGLGQERTETSSDGEKWIRMNNPNNMSVYTSHYFAALIQTETSYLSGGWPSIVTMQNLIST